MALVSVGDFAGQKTLDASLYLQDAKLYRWSGTNLKLISDPTFGPRDTVGEGGWTAAGSAVFTPPIYPSAAPSFVSPPGDLYAAAVQLAINAAPGLGCTAVWIPASMLPYTASLVTFNAAIHMLAEGGPTDTNIFWTYAYGVPEDGVTDATAAVQTVENVRVAGQTLKFTYGKTYLLSASTGATVLRTKAAGSWDFTGATLKYGGAGNLLLGSDSVPLAILNVLNAPFQFGGMGATIDCQSKALMAAAFHHTLSGIGLVPELTVLAPLEGQNQSLWAGLQYQVSQDVSGVAVSSARAKNVHGTIIRPSCPVSNFQDTVVEHGDTTAVIYGSNVPDILGTNASVASTTGFAIQMTPGAAGSNNLVQMCRLGSHGVVSGQVVGGIGQPLLVDLMVHDVGPTTQEQYGQYLPVAQHLTWATTITPDASSSIVKVITVTSDIAATIATPTSPPGAVDRDMYMRFIVRNNLGAFLTTPIKFTSGTNAYDAQGPINPGPGLYVVVDFVYDQPNNVWVECNRSRVPGVFICDATSYSSPAGSPVAIKTFVIPANTMLANQGVRMRLAGHSANNASAKSIQVLIGATQLITLTCPINTTSVWATDLTLMVRTVGNNAQVYTGFGDAGPAGLGPNHYNAGFSVTFDSTADQTIKVQATQTSAADLFLDQQLVEFVGQ